MIFQLFRMGSQGWLGAAMCLPRQKGASHRISKGNFSKNNSYPFYNAY